MEIFRYGAIKNSAQEVNGSHFPIRPPAKHTYLIKLHHTFNNT